MSALPHLSTEFFAWLWYASERGGGRIDLGSDLGSDLGEIVVFVDDRLSLRGIDALGNRTVLTGADIARAVEAKAALGVGKVVQEIRLCVQLDEREYALTLRAPTMDVHGLVLPPVAGNAADPLDQLFARMEAIEEVWGVLGALYRSFATVRTSPAWRDTIVKDVREWLREDA